MGLRTNIFTAVACSCLLQENGKQNIEAKGLHLPQFLSPPATLPVRQRHNGEETTAAVGQSCALPPWCMHAAALEKKHQMRVCYEGCK